VSRWDAAFFQSDSATCASCFEEFIVTVEYRSLLQKMICFPKALPMPREALFWFDPSQCP